MKKTLIALIAISSLSSCAQLDGWLVKKTGLKSDQLISIGISVKNKTQQTVDEIKYAQKQNAMTSAKGVVEVEPIVIESEKQYSAFGNIPYLNTILTLIGL